MTAPSSVPQFVPELHVVVTIMAGTKHANPLPAPPAGRKLERVWTVIDEERLRTLGPVHNVSAFMEENLHDYTVRNGVLRYYSRVTEVDRETRVVLDYETTGERRTRMNHAPNVRSDGG